jgi:hypothetical protein
MSSVSTNFNDKPLSFDHIDGRGFEKLVEAKDKLEVREYAQALSSFISDCDTPMTVGVQGDWGIGKTSMLNTVKAYLKGSDSDTNKTGMVWVNTWHYSLFGQDEYLGLSVIKGILEHLKAQFNIKENEPVMDKALGYAKNLIKNAKVSVAGVSVSANDVSSDPQNISFEDVSGQMKGFKESLENLIKTITANNKVNRIVFFIDDLDRVKPVKALELLEVLKNFFDIEDCVFVLAVDYEVVQMGMEQKYGVDLQKKSGKSFFDKIIQLPFIMPSTSYNLANYIQTLLNEVNIQISDDDKGFYDEITSLTVGRNPRSVKRVVNYAKLIKNIRDQRADNQRRNSTEQRQIIYALICMQIAWPEIFAYFANSATESTIKQIENWEEQEKIPYINKLYERTPNIEQLKSNISAYFDLLFELIDKDTDGSLGENELKPVWDALYVAKLTSTTDFKEPFEKFKDNVVANSKKSDSFEMILSQFRTSKWVAGRDISYTLSGKRYVTMIYKRKQIGSLVTLKTKPLTFRLDVSDASLVESLMSKYDEELLKTIITSVTDSSMTGYGNTIIQLSKIPKNIQLDILLNDLFDKFINIQDSKISYGIS